MVIFWSIALILFVIIEALTVSLLTIWFAGGSLIALILAILNVPKIIQIIAFFLISILLLLYVKPFAQKHIKIHKTNTDSIIGEKCIVIEDINELAGTGRVKINGIDWSAKTSSYDITIDKGKIVIIDKIEGVTLIVREDYNLVINEDIKE